MTWKPAEPGTLPTCREMTEDLRDGLTLEQLAQRYGTTAQWLKDRLHRAGYTTSGDVVSRERSAPSGRLVDSAGGSGNHVGGGDNHDSLPAQTVYRQPRPKPTGLNWAALRPAGEPLMPSSPNIVLKNGRTFYKEPPAAKPHRRRGPGNFGKLNEAQKDEICRRYVAGESASALGRAFGVQPASILYLLRSQEVPTRSRSEAAKLSRNAG